MSSFAVVVSPLVIMMFVNSITPGPNNLMLMLAGTHFGFRQTLPHLLGITLGAMLVICLTYAGLGTLLLGHPRVVDGMTVACVVYLCWMASKVIAPKRPARSDRVLPVASRPMRMSEALIFQFVNPKVWTMAVAATSIAARFPYSPATTLAVIATVIAVVNSPCIALWAAFGKILRHRLANPRTQRVFDGSMAVLLLATALWLAWPIIARTGALDVIH